MQDESVPEAVAPPHTRAIVFEEAVAAIGLLLMLVQVCTEIVLRDFFNTSCKAVQSVGSVVGPKERDEQQGGHSDGHCSPNPKPFVPVNRMTNNKYPN